MTSKLKDYITQKKLAGINGKRPRKDFKRASERKYLYFFLRSNGYSFQTIGEFFNVNHSSVLIGIKQYHDIKRDKLFQECIKEVKSLFPIYEKTDFTPENERAALIELENYGSIHNRKTKSNS
jgi:hypothetical protein